MSTFVFRLEAPRPSFALDMTDEEREIMARHAAYWKPLVDSGQMVVFGPVLDGGGSWGLGVIEADDENEPRAFAGWSGGHLGHGDHRDGKDARGLRAPPAERRIAWACSGACQAA